MSTTTKVRIAIAAAVVGSVAVEWMAEQGYLWAEITIWVAGILWVLVASLFIVGLLVYGRRDRRNETASKTTSIQALPFGEYADGEPATFYFPEGGER